MMIVEVVFQYKHALRAKDKVSVSAQDMREREVDERERQIKLIVMDVAK
jgi:hypothetical protein